MDRVAPEQRSQMMRAVRSANTVPEMRVRRLAHRLGFRFRLHGRKLPGTPDLVFPRLRLVIFVHGCFWHQHDGCSKTTIPASNVDFWTAKLGKNQTRDERVRRHLEELGWKVEVIWECQTKDRNLEERLKALLADQVAASADRKVSTSAASRSTLRTSS